MHGCMASDPARPAPDAALPPALGSWDDIRFFLAIYRAGSLSAAAGPLGVTQPTCGRRLASLEAALGFALFERTPSGLCPTRRAEALLDAARRMEDAALALSVRATAGEGEATGLVRIGTTDLLASAFLVGAISLLRERHPGITVELALSTAEADLLHREVDLAVRFLPEGVAPAPEVLVGRRLGREPFLLYGADAYLRRRGLPSDPARLSGHDVVIFSGRSPASSWCARAFEGATVALSAPSMQVTGAAMAAGLGLGVLPARAARLFPSLRPLSPAIAQAEGWILVHPDLRRVPRIRAVAELIAAEFRRDAMLAEGASSGG
jgi:DNA-binding transcriptional LysR family regulator